MDATQAQRLSEVVTLLHDRTEARTLAWQTHRDDDSRAIIAPIGENKIVVEIIFYKQGTMNLQDVQISILSSKGDVSDSVTDSDLTEYIPSPKEELNWYEYMLEIIDHAERQIRRADDILDDVLAHLRN